MTTSIKFGTDGWRGIIAEDFTFANVRACAQGVADHLKDAKRTDTGIVIGYDMRFASENFAAAAAEVIAANGMKVYLCSTATPTPVISFGVLAKQACGAIIITASHNPPLWNGLKFKSEHGSSAPDEVTTQMEQLIARAQTAGVKRLPLARAVEQCRVEYIDLRPVYYEQVKKLVDLDRLCNSGLKVVFDPMYGAGIGYMRALLRGSNLKLTVINGKRNPIFPTIDHPEPIARNLANLSATVRRKHADVGLATDGDADRMGIVDENGKFLNQLQVFALLCLYMLEVRGERGPIVKTLTTTSMAWSLGKLFNVPVFETAVGFKYVAPVMMKENALIGGEESGGYGFRNHVPERDGILANLYFLDLMVRTGKTPSQLIDYLYSKVGPHHYDRIDVEFPADCRQAIIDRVRSSAPQAIDGVKVDRLDTSDGFRFMLVDGSWLLIRFSGTEPVLRIYAETDSIVRVQRFLEEGKKLAGV